MSLRFAGMAHWISSWGSLTRLQNERVLQLARRKGVTAFPADNPGRWRFTGPNGYLVLDPHSGFADLSTEHALKLLQQFPDSVERK